MRHLIRSAAIALVAAAAALACNTASAQNTTTPTLVYEWVNGSPLTTGIATLRVSLDGDVSSTNPGLVATSNIRIAGANVRLVFPNGTIDTSDPPGPNVALTINGDDVGPANTYTLQDGITPVVNPNWPRDIGTAPVNRAYTWSAAVGNDTGDIQTDTPASGLSTLNVSLVEFVGSNTRPVAGEVVPFLDFTFFVATPVSSLSDFQVQWGESPALYGLDSSDLDLFPMDTNNALRELRSPVTFAVVDDTLIMSGVAGSPSTATFAVASAANSFGNLEVTGITEISDPDNVFSIVGPTTASLAPSATTNFTVQLNSASTGTFSATYQVETNSVDIDNIDDVRVVVTANVVSGVADWSVID
jgi:hypothetical protein